MGSRSIRFHYNSKSKLNSAGHRRRGKEAGGVEGGDGADDDDGGGGSSGGSVARGENGVAAAGAGEKVGWKSKTHRNRAARERGVKGGRGLQGKNEESARVDVNKQV